MARKSIIVMHLSAAEVASGNGRVCPEFANWSSAIFYLSITAASGTTPTLDVYITEFDESSLTWTAQAAAIAKFPQQITTTTNGIRLPVGYGVTVPAVTDAKQLAFRGFGTNLRCEWVIGGTTPSFTFMVTAQVETEEAG